MVSKVRRIFPFNPDLKDEPYINLAIVSKSRYLVSRDNDILGLADASTPDGERLQKEAPYLQIVSPVAFLEEIRRYVESSERRLNDR